MNMYTIEELQEQFPDAFQKAYENWTQYNLEYDWWEYVYEDFIHAADLLGVDTDAKRMQFSGFWSQGDGASFEGTYYYRKGAAKAIRKYAPRDTELHKIADTLQQIQRPHFYRLSAVITSSHRGFCLSVDVRDDDYYHPYHDINEAADGIAECMRDLAHWLYKNLEREYEHLQSEESCIESCMANEFLFTEDGELCS